MKSGPLVGSGREISPLGTDCHPRLMAARLRFGIDKVAVGEMLDHVAPGIPMIDSLN